MINVKRRENYIKEEHIAEEVLELIWTAEEEYGKLEKELLFEKFGKEEMENTLRELTESKLIKFKEFRYSTDQNRAR